MTFSADEPTGGTHMTLVLAGALNKPFSEAEEIKKAKENEADVFTFVRPVAEKMADMVARWGNEREECVYGHERGSEG